MINENTHNLFQFIDFLHSNIENFKLYEEIIKEWEEAIYQEYRYELYCLDKTKLTELEKTTETKWNVVYDNIYKPIDEKSLEFNIYDPEHLHIECFNLDLHHKLDNKFFFKTLELKKDVVKNDIPKIVKAKRQYIEIRTQSNINELYAILFEKLDEIMSPVLKVFWEEGDKSIPKTKINLLSRQQRVKSIIEINIQPNQINELFNFIEFLYSNIAYIKEHNKIVDEYLELRIKEAEFSPAKNYKERLEQQDIEDKIDAKKIVIHTNITDPIISRAESLGIYDASQSLNIWDLNMPAIDELKQNLSLGSAKLVQKYEQKYVDFRDATNYREYDCFFLFDSLDIILDNLFSYFSDSGKSKLKVSKDKHYESLRALTSIPTDNIDLQANSNEDKFVNKKPNPIKVLFVFIEYLYANIDNFNQYDNVILEINKTEEKISQLGFHYTEVSEKKALQEEINEKWDVIFRNIESPIKDKVAELNLFDWYAPETLSNKYFHIANTLSKTCEEKDWDAILKAKTQYIEFTNRISSNVIKQNHILFKYLQESMVEIAKNFWEKGDKSIKKIEVKKVGTFQELIDSYKAGEIASLHFDITSQLSQVEVEEEQKSKEHSPKNIDSTFQVEQTNPLKTAEEKTKRSPGRPKRIVKDVREYLKFHHDESKETFLDNLKQLDYIKNKKAFVHLIKALDDINKLENAPELTWKESFEKEFNVEAQSKQNFNTHFNKPDEELLTKISRELNYIVNKNELQ